jgi:hypothetical protein
VKEFVENIPGITTCEQKGYEMTRKNNLLRQYGFIDGKNFRNAGDKERLAYES